VDILSEALVEKLRPEAGVDIDIFELFELFEPVLLSELAMDIRLFPLLVDDKVFMASSFAERVDATEIDIAERIERVLVRV
jgi:hypothetical protein